MCKTLYIVGNGFDLLHDMHTKYCHFLGWLVSHRRFNSILELESMFPSDSLWSDFETALGEYDVNKVADWGISSLYLMEEVDYSRHVEPEVVELSLRENIQQMFTEWVEDVELAERRATYVMDKAYFLTFNYTDTLEYLYGISSERILHIHGQRKTGQRLIVGHCNYVDPSTLMINSNSVMANNNRFQNICEMNDMLKPSQDIIDRNDAFWKMLQQVDYVIEVGHSCAYVDYPYYEKVKSSVAPNARWKFYIKFDKDRTSVETLTQRMGVKQYVISKYPQPCTSGTNNGLIELI